ncbi:hypothetical protein QWY86_15390 [Pedobacter aquatilis]|uniref:hypothetical protein n=1 Tax=Pedobacter aquatilis TaxID=351343 RepID=UPI0025B33FD6|nr:hypothetical protein [Pedobacter aquatilis]MDN3588066.1 hypothetical protein [Pedobacter aquatilis]
MKDIFDQIVEHVKIVAEKQEGFSLPNFPNVIKTEATNENKGATLLDVDHLLELDGDRINVNYVSKDRCRTFQIQPDSNEVNISLTCKDGTSAHHREYWLDKI